MSVQSEITRIQNNVADTYTALAELGATLPASADQNSDNLAATAMTIRSAGQSLTMTDQNGNQVVYDGTEQKSVSYSTADHTHTAITTDAIDDLFE